MSFDKASKANQKIHRERSQLSSRQHLGLLEKKKDYKQRAEDFHKKQKTLKVLKRRAQEKNPDEFYFNMVRSKLVEGVHTQEQPVPQYSEDQLKLMTTQDLKYIKYKHSTERKKIEKLRGSLHFVSDEQQNKHIVFCDGRKKAKTSDPDEHGDSDPDTCQPTGSVLMDLDDETLTELAKETTKRYKELKRRLEREKQLRITAEKMALKTSLLDTKSKKTKVQEETVDRPAQYKWEPRRKR